MAPGPQRGFQGAGVDWIGLHIFKVSRCTGHRPSCDGFEFGIVAFQAFGGDAFATMSLVLNETPSSRSFVWTKTRTLEEPARPCHNKKELENSLKFLLESIICT